MNKKQYFNISIFFTLMCIGLIISLVYSEKIFSLNTLIVITIAVALYMIFYYRKSISISIINAFIFAYYIPLFQHYLLKKKLTPYTENFVGNIDEKVAFLYCIFYLTYAVICLNYSILKKQDNNFLDNIKVKNNSKLYFLSILIIIICIIFGHTGSINLGSYGVDSSPTILNEYIIIFFFTAYYYSDNKTINKIILLGLFFVYVVINFLYGDRIGVLQVGIMLFLIYFSRRFTYKSAIVLVVMAIFTFQIIGILRTGGDLKSYSQYFVEKRLSRAMDIDNNQSQVFNSAITIVSLREDNILTKSEGLDSFCEYTKRLVLSKDNLNEYADLNTLSKQFYTNQGGGFIISYFYIWLSYLGVILSGGIIAFIVIKSERVKNENASIFILIVISMIPRWLAYDPIQLIKIPMYTLIVVKLFIIINRYRLKLM